jgi:hypothetical protein
MMDNGLMFALMILSGLLSTMNVFADKLSDVRWSLNDLYMAFLMTGWMFLLMGLSTLDRTQMMIGSLTILVSFLAIRTQLFIGQTQYFLGMIPHHSMAVFMSKKLLTKDIDSDTREFVSKIISGQEREISWMKNHK